MAAGFNFGLDPETLAQMKQQELLQQRIQEQNAVLSRGIETAQSPEERLGFTVGTALGRGARSLFGSGGSQEEQAAAAAERDPEIIAARRQAEIAKQLQELPNAGTAAWYDEAAPLLAKAGMHEQALQMKLRGREVAKTELAADRQLAKETKVAELAEWNSMSSSQKMMITAENPERAQAAGNLTDEQAASMQEEAKAFVEANRLKAAKALEAIKAPRQTKVTSKDVELFGDVMNDAGFGETTFRKWLGMAPDDDKIKRFQTNMKMHTQAVRDAAASTKGVTVTDQQILRSIKSQAIRTGALEVDDTGDVISIDGPKFQLLMDDQLNQFQDKEGAAPSASAEAVAPARRKPIDLTSGAF